MLNDEIQKNLRFNAIVNILDGCFFGFGVGFASIMMVIPLFLAELTDSKMLIGFMTASVQAVGWQVPQLLTASHIAGLTRFKPMVLKMTLHERWPLLALAFVALLIPTLGTTPILILTVLLLGWRSFGAGFTANVWQNMIGKVIPRSYRGTFWGIQFAGSNLLAAGSMVIAGILLEKIAYPHNYALCFFIATFGVAISWWFLSLTREPVREVSAEQKKLNWSHFLTSGGRDKNLWLFLLARALTQFGWMAVSFYALYGKSDLKLSESTVGIMFGVLTLSSIISPALGWMGDHWGHRRIYALAMLALAGSVFIATSAPRWEWLYAAFALAGFANEGMATIILSMTLEFGSEEERPYCIGLSNAMTAPASLAAPFIGGWLADVYGFDATFTLALIAALVTALVLLFLVQDPGRKKKKFAPVTPDCAPEAAETEDFFIPIAIDVEVGDLSRYEVEHAEKG